jgi:hypothetical protein
MESKINLEIQLQIVEDTLGKLDRERVKVEQIVSNIDRENRRRERWGYPPIPGLGQEEAEENERQRKGIKHVMAVLRVEWTNITNQLTKCKD